MLLVSAWSWLIPSYEKDMEIINKCNELGKKFLEHCCYLNLQLMTKLYKRAFNLCKSMERRGLTPPSLDELIKSLVLEHVDESLIQNYKTQGNPILDMGGYFKDVSDPRQVKKSDHLLNDILAISLCAIISGAQGWTDMETFGKTNEAWFRQFLELPNGIPSHDTFGRVYSLLNPDEFTRCFIRWVESIRDKVHKDIIAIDGKKLRHSFDNASAKSAIHMVSAWSSANGLVLGQVKVNNKSNEITAIPQLLKLIDVENCIVTIDAMGCQKKIAEVIIDQGADYVLALKGNQGNLHQAVENYLTQARMDNFKDIAHSFEETVNDGHGRVEIRRHWITTQIDWLKEKESWKGLKSIAMVESERYENAKTSIEQRYYITSLPADAKQFAKAVRNHWGIENSLHWVLDVVFREDDSRIRKDHAPQNMAILRHMALNLLKKEISLKRGIKGKRLQAAWDKEYLLKVLLAD